MTIKIVTTCDGCDTAIDAGEPHFDLVPYNQHMMRRLFGEPERSTSRLNFHNLVCLGTWLKKERS